MAFFFRATSKSSKPNGVEDGVTVIVEALGRNSQPIPVRLEGKRIVPDTMGHERAIRVSNSSLELDLVKPNTREAVLHTTTNGRRRDPLLIVDTIALKVTGGVHARSAEERDAHDSIQEFLVSPRAVVLSPRSGYHLTHKDIRAFRLKRA